MGLFWATAKILGMSKGEQGVKNQFKDMSLLISPEPLKQLCITTVPITTDTITTVTITTVTLTTVTIIHSITHSLTTVTTFTTVSLVGR